MKILSFIIIVHFVLFFPQYETYSQKNINHRYPRKATLQWGGGTVDWLSRFNLVITRNRDSAVIRMVQALHPEIYLLSTTDWNEGEPIRDNGLDPLPTAWRVRSQNGTYIRSNHGEYLADFTQYCGLYNNERYNQALPRILWEKTDWIGFDGVNSDGLWTFPWRATESIGIDLDRNGLNDYNEPGKGMDWVEQKWQAGCRVVMENLRERYKTKWGNPYQKLIAYWSLSDTMASGIANGIGWENAPDHGPDLTSWKSLITKWEAAGPSPNINYVCAAVQYDSSHAPVRKKDYFRFMRWMLGITLMNDSYYMMTDDDGGHWYNFYYDEFDVDLGYPTGAMQVLSNGCWVRYFNNGVVIVNPTNSQRIITSSDLTGGPYYHFRGNQDPVYNDGSLFTSDTLVSTKASWPGNTQNVGDGIILVKKPTTVVSDIIIDNAYAGTSPGSPEAALAGFTWDNEASSNRANPLWYTGPYMDDPSIPDVWRSQYAPPGSGSSVAVFRPTINVSGRYNVYEWHGWRGEYSSSYREASNIPCTIVHGGGRNEMTIDQSKNYGQWNLIGTFVFKAGGNASVTITNNANGSVIADAFMFRYVDSDSSVIRGKIEGQIFFDKNNNHIKDLSESGIAGWAVHLSGSRELATEADSAGYYVFNDLPPGNYVVSEEYRASWTQTYPLSPITYTINVSANQSEFVCNFGNYSDFVISHQIVSGWNIVSVPMTVTDPRTSAIFPSAISDASYYNGSYISAESLQCGMGYWIKFPQPTTNLISGIPLTGDTIDVKKGWNLIGSIGVPIPVDQIFTIPDTIISSYIFGYDNGNFFADTIKPGNGYWIQTTQDGKIVLENRLNHFRSGYTYVNEIHEMNSLTFQTSQGYEQPIYFTDNYVKALKFFHQSPPLPPIGAFDVRFFPNLNNNNGSFVAIVDTSALHGVNIPIRVQSVSYPLKIRWHIINNDIDYVLKLDDGTTYLIKGTDSLNIINKTDKDIKQVRIFTLRSISTNQTTLPSSLELFQNYPNPFNSATEIPFFLPADGSVQLTVHNIIGESIYSVNTRSMLAGMHTISFDASYYPSGVYFYKINFKTTSGNTLSRINRMMILK